MGKEFDVVAKPKHYNSGKIEVWDWYEMGLSDDEFRGAMKANIFKYVSRYQIKGGLEDLKKAMAYLNRLIDFESGVRTEWMKGPVKNVNGIIHYIKSKVPEVRVDV